LLWDLGPGVAHLGTVVVGLAFLLGVTGLLTPGPTTAGMEARAKDPAAIQGVLKITRHPFLWSVALWSAFHLAANGDGASVVFFGTFLVLAVAGTYSIDAKRARKLGGDWQDLGRAGYAQAKRVAVISFGGCGSCLSGRAVLARLGLRGLAFPRRLGAALGVGQDCINALVFSRGYVCAVH
jgi:uncharacterized membrane protein